MFKRFFETSLGIVGGIFIIIGLTILALAISLLWFTLGYWLITLIMPTFFGILIPFTYNYILGGWLISLIIGTFILPFRINLNNN